MCVLYPRALDKNHINTITNHVGFFWSHVLPCLFLNLSLLCKTLIVNRKTHLLKVYALKNNKKTSHFRTYFNQFIKKINNLKCSAFTTLHFNWKYKLLNCHFLTEYCTDNYSYMYSFQDRKLLYCRWIVRISELWIFFGIWFLLIFEKKYEKILNIALSHFHAESCIL